MKIILLSILAVAMIGLMVPSVFAENFGTEIDNKNLASILPNNSDLGSLILSDTADLTFEGQWEIGWYCSDPFNEASSTSMTNPCAFRDVVPTDTWRTLSIDNCAFSYGARDPDQPTYQEKELLCKAAVSELYFADCPGNCKDVIVIIDMIELNSEQDIFDVNKRLLEYQEEMQDELEKQVHTEYFGFDFYEYDCGLIGDVKWSAGEGLISIQCMKGPYLFNLRYDMSASINVTPANFINSIWDKIPDSVIEQQQESTQPAYSYEPTHVSNFPDPSKSPEHYLDRYNNEDAYREWFDSQFPDRTIHEILGIPEPAQPELEPEPVVNKIPAWIKNNAGWWADGQIPDSAFVQGIQFLIKDGVIVIPSTEHEASSESTDIPAWIKNNAGWWADGQIPDSAFVQGIQFLIKEGIINLNE